MDRMEVYEVAEQVLINSLVKIVSGVLSEFYFVLLGSFGAEL